MASDLIKAGGLWTNKDKNGKTYLTGKLSPTVRILIFANEFRESENQPTHILYFSQVEQQREGDDPDEFFDPNQAPRPGYGAQRTDTQGYGSQRSQAPEDVPAARPAPLAPRPPARQPAPAPRQGPAGRGGYRQPSPPPDFDDLQDPFAE